MAASKFLKLLVGRPTEEAPVTSGGVGNADRIPALDAAGLLAPSMFPAGIGADVVTAPASEALSAGNYVNIYNNGGAAACRKADASTSGKEANGFVLAGVSSGATATIYRHGANTAVTGQTIGDVYLSDSTPGTGQSTPPVGAGKTVQKLGKALSAALVDCQPGQDYVLA